MGSKNSIWKLTEASGTTAYTGTAGNSTAAGVGIRAVRVVCTTAAFIRIGKTAVAVADDTYMPANVPEVFQCFEGERVSAIQVSSGGNLHVTYLTNG